MSRLVSLFPLLLLACAAAPGPASSQQDPAAGPLHRFVLLTAAPAEGRAAPQPGAVLPLDPAPSGGKDDLTAALAKAGLRTPSDLDAREVALELDREVALSTGSKAGWYVTLRALLTEQATYLVRWRDPGANVLMEKEVRLAAGDRAAVVGPGTSVGGEGRIQVLVVELGRGARLNPVEPPSAALTDPPPPGR
jgi:hypothetical protein